MVVLTTLLGTLCGLRKVLSSESLEILGCRREKSLASGPSGHGRYSTEPGVPTEGPQLWLELPSPLQGKSHINRHFWIERVLCPSHKASKEKKQTPGMRLVPTFVEIQNEDTVVPLYYYLLSPTDSPGTVLSTLYINYYI